MTYGDHVLSCSHQPVLKYYHNGQNNDKGPDVSQILTFKMRLKSIFLEEAYQKISTLLYPLSVLCVPVHRLMT